MLITILESEVRIMEIEGNRFTKACILLVISENPMDKPGLRGELDFFGFDEDDRQDGVLSRVLKTMEDESLLSTKDDVYDITPKGMEQLGIWIKQQRDMMERIETLVNRYDRAFLA